MYIFILFSDKKGGSKSKKGSKKHFDYLYGGHGYGHGLGHGYGYGYGHGHGHYGYPTIPWGFGFPYGVYGRYVVLGVRVVHTVSALPLSPCNLDLRCI